MNSAPPSDPPPDPPPPAAAPSSSSTAPHSGPSRRHRRRPAPPPLGADARERQHRGYGHPGGDSRNQGISAPLGAAAIILSPRPFEELHNERAYLLAALRSHEATAATLARRHSTIEGRLAPATGEGRRAGLRHLRVLRGRIADTAEQEKAILLRLSELHVEIQNRERLAAGAGAGMGAGMVVGVGMMGAMGMAQAMMTTAMGMPHHPVEFWPMSPPPPAMQEPWYPPLQGQMTEQPIMWPGPPMIAPYLAPMPHCQQQPPQYLLPCPVVATFPPSFYEYNPWGGQQEEDGGGMGAVEEIPGGVVAHGQHEGGTGEPQEQQQQQLEGPRGEMAGPAGAAYMPQARSQRMSLPELRSVWPE